MVRSETLTRRLAVGRSRPADWRIGVRETTARRLEDWSSRDHGPQIVGKNTTTCILEGGRPRPVDWRAGNHGPQTGGQETTACRPVMRQHRVVSGTVTRQQEVVCYNSLSGCPII